MHKYQSPVLITGGMGGIGWACAERFAEAGHRVVVTSRSRDRLAALESLSSNRGERIESSGGRIEGVQASLDDSEEIDALIARIGVPCVLVNSAGINRPAPFLDADLADFDAVFAVNVKSLFLITQRVCRAMHEAKASGAVVNVSSQAGSVGLPERVVYCASKHAVEGLTRAIAVDLKGSGIRINCVAPTFVETPMTQQTLSRPEFRELIDAKLLQDALPTTRDVAEAIYFLASPQASGITGTCLKVDSGWTAH